LKDYLEFYNPNLYIKNIGDKYFKKYLWKRVTMIEKSSNFALLKKENFSGGK
jgi:hypothetical protein